MKKKKKKKTKKKTKKKKKKKRQLKMVKVLQRPRTHVDEFDISLNRVPLNENKTETWLLKISYCEASTNH